MATTGGKHLFDSPVSFENGSVNVGDEHTFNTGTHSTVVGPSQVNSRDDSVVVGYSNTCTGAGSDVVAVGHSLSVTTAPLVSSARLILVGYNVSVTNPTLAGGVCSDIVAIGSTISATVATAGTVNDSVLIGRDLQVNDFHSIGGARGVAIGVGLYVDNSVVLGTNDGSNKIYPPRSVYAGWLQHVGTGGNSHVVVGYATSLGNECDRCTLVGSLSTITPVASVLQSVAVFGDSNTVTGPYSSRTLVAGTGNSVTSTVNDTVLGQNNVLSTTNNSGFVVIGNNHSVSVTGPSTVVGQYITITTGWSVAIGYGFTADASIVVGNPQGGAGSVYPTGSVYVGLLLDVGAGGATNVVLGNDVTHGTGTTDTVVVGNSASLGNNVTSTTVTGHEAIADANSTRACGFGYRSHVGGSGSAFGAETIAADFSVALGYLASAATSHTCEVGGSSDPTADIGVNVFTVRGSQGVSPAVVNIITVQATTTPDVDEIGLVVTYNDGDTIANKTVKAAVVPPVGSVLLYVDP